MASRLKPASLTVGTAAVVWLVAASSPGVARSPAPQQVTKAPAPAGDCVTIGTPKAGVGYTYSHVESTGAVTEYTQYWERVTDTGSRVRIVKPRQTLIQTSVYKVVDDVARITRMTKAEGTRVTESLTFSAGLVSDPVFRACAGRVWAVPSVMAEFSGTPSGRAPTPSGTLTITNVRARQTTPAGTFDAVEYVRTSQSRDVYWKSTVHGVIVKHVATVAGHTVTETLIRIR
jgi:hypothetical protein